MELRGDLKLASRGLRRQAGLASTILLTLALGIGATTAVFSVVNAVVLSPLPYAEPERLLRVYTAFPEMKLDRFAASPPEFFELQRGVRSFDGLGGFSSGAANVADGTTPVRAETTVTTGQLLSLLGVAPALGRLYGDAATLPGAPAVGVLGHGLWQRAFGGDPAIVGRSIRIDGVPTEVVGIMPKGFDFPGGTEVWLPLTLDPADTTRRASHYLGLVARLRRGVTATEARGELQAFMKAHEQDHRSEHRFDGKNHLVFALGLQDDVVGDARSRLLLLLGATGFVLLIACANVAGLMLARAGTREREVAVQSALGASRGRLVRQLLAESLLLSVVGGGLGIGVAHVALRAILAMDPGSVPRAGEITLSAPVLIFALAAAVVTGVLFGLVPALSASRPDLVEALKATGSRTTAGRGALGFRRGLVVAEVALAVVLVVGAGLLLRSFAHLLSVNPGFDPARLLTFEIALPEALYAKDGDVLSFFARVEDRLRSLPGVEGVTLVGGLPPLRDVNANDISFEGKTPSKDGPIWNVDYWQIAGGRYFDTLKIALREGRGLDERDGAGATPVAVINEAMARKFWPGESPVGRRVKAVPDDAAPWVTVVGVMADVKQAGLSEPAGTEITFPAAQLPAISGAAFRTMSVAVRSSSRDPLSLLPSVRAAMAELDGSLPMARIRTMEELIGASLARARFVMTLLGAFAGLALLLAAVGIYGLLSHVVGQRTNEIGVRMALGARRSTILTSVLGHGLGLVAGGVALGLLGAFGLRRLVSSLVFGIGANDPVTFGAVAFILLAVALLACLVPAARAMRVDPMVALRYE